MQVDAEVVEWVEAQFQPTFPHQAEIRQRGAGNGVGKACEGDSAECFRGDLEAF